MGSKSDPQNSKLAKIKKFVEALIPFLILIAYTLVISGVYYAIEINHCNINTRPLLLGQSSAGGLQIFWQALHFVAMIESTIGFGDVSPCTVWGQLVTIIFALIGIPLFLVCLTHLGKWLQIGLNKLYLKIKKFWKENKTIGERKAAVEDNGIDTNFVPLSIGIGVTLLWILFCSIYFYFSLKPFYTDGFTYFTAVYFTIITFFTIGLGDISPVDYDLIIITIILITIGLALVAMCIEIVQRKLEMMFDNVERLIEREYKMKLAKDGDDMSEDPSAANESVAQLFKEDPNAKWFSTFMSDKNKKELIEAYQNKAKMKCKSVQTEAKQTSDASTHAVPDQDEAEPKPASKSPKPTIVPRPFKFNARRSKNKGSAELSPMGESPISNEPLPIKVDRKQPTFERKPEPSNVEPKSSNVEPIPYSDRRNTDPQQKEPSRNFKSRGRNLI